MTPELSRYTELLEQLAHEKGLEYYPVDFELVPPSFMTEVAVYGLPVRMPHWSFGVRYIYQLVQHRMGHSRLFEVVFPGNPSRAYLANTNSTAENTLVVAHVFGHADFSKNNALFRKIEHQIGHQIVEQAAAKAHQIARAIEEYGQERVETVLDAALALEQHIDVTQEVQRKRYMHYTQGKGGGQPGDPFYTRFESLPGHASDVESTVRKTRVPLPPHEEFDLLWFIAQYAPEMEGWERDIFLSVREESFYFYPVFACQIMNEGWASYWHAHLLRSADFLPEQLYVDAIKTHSDVVRPHAGQNQAVLSINPYHVGFCMWEKIIGEVGLDQARTIMQHEDDFSFIRNYLDDKLARDLQLFAYIANPNGEIKVKDTAIDEVREAILGPKFNFGAPRISVTEVQNDGTLELRHHFEIDGKGLDTHRALKVLQYIRHVWRRNVFLHTLDEKGEDRLLTA